jgi:hypothetical protein
LRGGEDEVKLYTIDCDPTCGFSVTSHDMKETKDMSMMHVKAMHQDMKFDPADADKMMKVSNM